MRNVYGIVLGTVLQALMLSGAHAASAVIPRIASWVIGSAVELPVETGDECVEVLHHLRDARKHRFVAMEAVQFGAFAYEPTQILITTQKNSRRQPETSIVSCKLNVEDDAAQSQALTLNQEGLGLLPWTAVNVQLRGVELGIAQTTGCAEGLTMLRRNRLKVMDKAIVGVMVEEALMPHTVYYLEEQGGKRKTALLVCQ